LLVLTKADVRYRRPAYYDDLLNIRTFVVLIRIDHRYEVWRGAELLVEATTTLACGDRNGRPQVPAGCPSRSQEEPDR
jgi:acyl-CoA thioester hydrolase